MKEIPCSKVVMIRLPASLVAELDRIVKVNRRAPRLENLPEEITRAKTLRTLAEQQAFLLECARRRAALNPRSRTELIAHLIHAGLRSLNLKSVGVDNANPNGKDAANV